MIMLKMADQGQSELQVSGDPKKVLLFDQA